MIDWYSVIHPTCDSPMTAKQSILLGCCSLNRLTPISQVNEQPRITSSSTSSSSSRGTFISEDCHISLLTMLLVDHHSALLGDLWFSVVDSLSVYLSVSSSPIDRIETFLAWWYTITASTKNWSSIFDLAPSSPKFISLSIEMWFTRGCHCIQQKYTVNWFTRWHHHIELSEGLPAC